MNKVPEGLEKAKGPELDGPSLSRIPPWVWALIPCLLVLLVFFPALKNDFVNWDDPEVILNNPSIRFLNPQSFRWMLTTLYTGNWMPLTWLTFALNFSWGGAHPFVFHLTNLLLHSLNTGLVFVVTYRLFKTANNGMSKSQGADHGKYLEIPTALLAALFFGLHPIHVESVAWATGRKDLLYAFFYLSSLYTYLKMPLGSGSSVSRLSVCWVFYLLSLMSKPMAITLPFVFLILDGWPLGRLKGRVIPDLLEKIPFWILAGLTVPITITGQYLAGSFSLMENYSAVFRFLNVFRSFAFYFYKMITPWDLVPFYPLPPRQNLLWNVESVSAFLAFAGISAALWVYREKVPYLLAPWMYLVVAFLPVLGIIQLGGQSAADRYAYLPSLGFFIPLAFWISYSFSGSRKIYFILVMGLSLFLGFLTERQIGFWKNSGDLWEKVIRNYPDCAIAHINLAAYYQEVGLLDQALEQYQLASTISPPNALAYNGWGGVLFQKGKRGEAFEKFKTANALDPTSPTTHWYLWYFYEQEGLHMEALKEINEAIRLNPRYVENYNSLGISLGSLGRLDESQKAFENALSEDPKNTVYLSNLASTQLKRGKLGEALDLYHQASLSDSKDYSFPLKMGELYLKMGRADRADEMFKRALLLKAGNTQVSEWIVKICKESGQKGMAHRYEKNSRP